VHQVIRESGTRAAVQRHRDHRRRGGDAGHGELGEDIFLKPVRRACRPIPARCTTWSRIRDPRPVMGLLEEARIARSRGIRAAQQAGSGQDPVGRAKDWFLGNF